MASIILDNLDSIATFAAGCFAGTTLYMSAIEVPAMRLLGVDEHWRFFPRMFQYAAPQPILAAIAGITGVLHGSRIIGSPYYRNLWIISGSTFLGVIGFTIVTMFPTNKMIINDNKHTTAGNQSSITTTHRKELLDKWVSLHLVRTISSVVGFGTMVYGLSRHTSLVLGW